MDEFSYLSVIVSIILGLGITRLLTGLGRLIEARDRVRVYGPAVAWAVFLLVIHVQSWWAMFGLRDHQDWSFLAFSVVLLQPILLYLLAALVLPEVVHETRMDLRESYYAHARWFFGLAMLLIVVSILKDVVIDGDLPERLNLTLQLVFMAFCGGAALTRSRWYHELLVPVNAVLIGLYIATLFARLA